VERAVTPAPRLRCIVLAVPLLSLTGQPFFLLLRRFEGAEELRSEALYLSEDDHSLDLSQAGKAGRMTDLPGRG